MNDRMPVHLAEAEIPSQNFDLLVVLNENSGDQSYDRIQLLGNMNNCTKC